MATLKPQSLSNIAAPLFYSVEQEDAQGNFTVELELPSQMSSIEPVRTVGGRRYYGVNLRLDGEDIHSGVYPENSMQHIGFTYTSTQNAYLTGCTVDKNGSKSDYQDCRYVVRYVMPDYAVSFEGCDNAMLSDCTIEGNIGGVSARGSSLSITDCEIILNGTAFIHKDTASTVFEQNVKKTTRN